MANLNETKSELSIEVSDLKIRPYDSTSRIANEFPGFDLFDSRSDFICFTNINHVAVAFKAVNLNFENKRNRASRELYHINICDVNSGMVVTSRSVSIRMTANEHVGEVREDIPLRRSQICLEHDYRVDLYHPGKNEILVSKPLRFFFAETLPTRYYSPQSAYLSDGVGECPEDEKKYRLISSSRTPDLRVVFMLEDTVFGGERVPEIYCRVVQGDEQTFAGLCKTEAVSGSKSMVRVSVDVSFEDSRITMCYVELQCMGYPFTGLVFDAWGDNEEGEFLSEELGYIKDYTLEEGDRIIVSRIIRVKEEKRRKEAMGAKAKLEKMIGLGSVKTKLSGYSKLVEFNRKRSDMGLPVTMPPLHAMFLGSPGTGKTTVAKIMGDILHGAGVLSKGHIMVRERATLLGQYYSSECEKTLEALEKAQGGILFIDEAYQLYQPQDPKDPGKFVLETLMTALSDESNRDWMLILAGYSGPMEKMLLSNPGLNSRIPSTNFYHFEDFTSEELWLIAESYFRDNGYMLTPDAVKGLQDKLDNDYQNRDKSFGNARHVMNLIHTAILPAMAERIAEIEDPSKDDLMLVKEVDIPAPIVLQPQRCSRIGFVG